MLILANILREYLHEASALDEPCAVLVLDMSQAVDRVNADYLADIFKEFQFLANIHLFN